MTICDLDEWSTAIVVDAGTPTHDDLELRAALQGRNQLSIDWLSDGTARLTSRSWVGVARFSRFEVRVVPKLVGGSLNVLAMYDYVAGLDLLGRLPQDRPLPTGGDHLLDLVCYLLASEAERLLEHGLYADYRSAHDTLPLLRGRLRVLDQVTRHFGRVDVLDCAFEEHDTDNLENQLVSAGIAAGVRHARDADLRRRLHRLKTIYAEACNATSQPSSHYRSRISYGRRNESYRNAHALSYLLLDNLGITDLYAHGTPRSFAFLIDMNVLFERFVSRLIVHAFRSSCVAVQVQRRDRSVVVHEATGASYGTVIPDFLREQRHSWRLPGDVKYKLYDERRLDPSDVYQVFLYAYAFHAGLDVPTAFIVYPRASTVVSPPRLRVQQLLGAATARIVGWGLDVPTTLSAIAGSATENSQLEADVRERILGLVTTAPIATSV